MARSPAHRVRRAGLGHARQPRRRPPRSRAHRGEFGHELPAGRERRTRRPTGCDRRSGAALKCARARPRRVRHPPQPTGRGLFATDGLLHPRQLRDLPRRPEVARSSSTTIRRVTGSRPRPRQRSGDRAPSSAKRRRRTARVPRHRAVSRRLLINVRGRSLPNAAAGRVNEHPHQRRRLPRNAIAHPRPRTGFNIPPSLLRRPHETAPYY
jgi:hypothetical protein